MLKDAMLAAIRLSFAIQMPALIDFAALTDRAGLHAALNLVL